MRSQKFCARRLSVFRWDVFTHFLYQDPFLFFLKAAWITLWISVVAQTCGVIIGLFIALMRMSRFPLLSMPARTYIWFFRGSPLLVHQLLVSLNCLFLLPCTTCCLPLCGATYKTGSRIAWTPIV